MADPVRMKSLTVFANERITVFKTGGQTEGEKGVAALVGDEFETDVAHANELDRAGLAQPLRRKDLDGEPGPLVAHHQVSVPDLLADQASRAAAEVVAREEAAKKAAKAPAKKPAA